MATGRWDIRDVDDTTKARIAAWARLRNLKVGEALAKIMDIVEKVEKK
jgi:hypothetical protein